MEAILYVIGGGVLGFLYWKWHGCMNGMCILQQNKYMSITIGALLGLMVVTSGCSQSDKPATVGGETATIQNAAVLEDIPAAAFAEKMKMEGVVILDVRTPEEFNTGYLAGAINMNYNAPDFADQLARLDRSKIYLVYCLSGGRSGNAGKLMSEKGFNTVYTLKGGISSWTGEVVK